MTITLPEELVLLGTNERGTTESAAVTAAVMAATTAGAAAGAAGSN